MFWIQCRLDSCTTVEQAVDVLASEEVDGVAGSVVGGGFCVEWLQVKLVKTKLTFKVDGDKPIGIAFCGTFLQVPPNR